MNTIEWSEVGVLDQEIDLSKIRHKAVKKFIHTKGLLQLSNFADLIHSCAGDIDTSKYNRHIKIFSFNEKPDKVWDAYKTIGPVETCSGSMLGFGLQYSRINHAVTYHEDDHGIIEVGQIVILNLNLLWNVACLAVGHEITEVNEDEKFIKMCYLQGGASKGYQVIRLKEMTDGSTEVAHETFYKSNSDFRDKRLYPYLHGRVITEFHKKCKKAFDWLVI